MPVLNRVTPCPITTEPLTSAALAFAKVVALPLPILTFELSVTINALESPAFTSNIVVLPPKPLFDPVNTDAVTSPMANLVAVKSVNFEPSPANEPVNEPVAMISLKNAPEIAVAVSVATTSPNPIFVLPIYEPVCCNDAVGIPDR